MSSNNNFKRLSDLFKDGLYSIPDYQRNYSWGERQLKDLWEDLEGIDLTTKSNHYTGTVVLEKIADVAKLGKTYTEFKIVDGQQRLATLSILISCICEKLSDFKNPESDMTATNLKNDYIQDSSLRFYKLNLNKDDEQFFKDVIVKEHKQEVVGKQPATASEERLLFAKGYFKKLLRNKDLTFLLALTEKVTSRLLLIKYEVGSEAEAGLVFEVMNDRGKPLTQVDKIKNYLIYAAYKKDDDLLANEINSGMGEIFRNLMQVPRFDEDDLLRYHWIMYTGQYETNLISDIHRLLKEDFKLKKANLTTSIRDYMTSLKEASFVFKEINNPFSSFKDWKVDAEKTRHYLNGLDRLKNMATFMPLLMAARIVYRDDPLKFEEISRYCETFAFRVYKIANRRTDTRYSSFCKLANELFLTRMQSNQRKDSVYIKILNDIRKSLNDYCDDIEFENNLHRLNFYYDWVDTYEVRYLLNEYENEKCLKNKEAVPNWEEIDKKAQIEHIWPVVPRNYGVWSKKLQNEHSENVYNLGNLTLTYFNQALSNKEFIDKKPHYLKSNIAIQRELAGKNSWSGIEIGNRTNEIVAFALSRWRL